MQLADADAEPIPDANAVGFAVSDAKPDIDAARQHGASTAPPLTEPIRAPARSTTLPDRPSTR
jgi:hypothetical protein